MICSMTGYAAAQAVEDGLCYAVEMRSVNHRYLKLSIKLPESFPFLENDIDRLIRERIRRGSVSYHLRVRRAAGGAMVSVDTNTLQAYVNQIGRTKMPDGVSATIDLGTLVSLPGVCEAAPVDDPTRQRLQATAAAITQRALEELCAMRRREGEALVAELQAGCEQIRKGLADVARRAPDVIKEYHQRLRSRVDVLLKESGLELETDGLMREIAVYADRCDITEEVARLRSHLDQFLTLCGRGEQVGRTLEFLTQELLREANTIASKSNDTAVAQSVVDIKGWIDRLREQVQNIE